MDHEQDPAPELEPTSGYTEPPEVLIDDGAGPSFAPHPAMSPHGMLTPADGFQSLLGAISAQSAPSLVIQVMGFLAQRPGFFPAHGTEWARFCAATADLVAAYGATAPVAAPARNLP